jgi:pimeloyl-ACP methyl ester carboxylesterase
MLLPNFIKGLVPRDNVRLKPRIAAQPGRTIVFVHGLGSSGIKTWTKLLSLCQQDPAFNTYTLAAYEYPTDKVRGPLGRPSIGLLDLAQGLRTELQTRYPEDEITLIGHSLGGLVVRQFLVDSAQVSPIPRIRAYLYAVPNLGSNIADAATALSLNNRQVELLRTGDDNLRRLNADWHRLQLGTVYDVRHAVAGLDQVVLPISARPTDIQQDYDFLNGFNHTNVVQPSHTNDIRYAVLRRFIFAPRAISHPGVPVAPSQAAGTSVAPGQMRPDPLFDVYTLPNETFYVHRDIDQTLVAVLAAGNGWLEGPSGSGKTAAVTRCVQQLGWKPIHMMLGGYTEHTALGLLRAMCIEMSDLCGSTEAPAADLICSDLLQFFRRIARLHPDRVLGVIVEEIPLTPGPEYDIFLRHMLSLVQLIQSDSSTNGRVAFAFTSIYPAITGCSGGAKLRDKIAPVAFPGWTHGELRQLIDMLCGPLFPDLPLEERAQLTEGAQGNPRFVKAVFRRWRNGLAGTMSTAELIAAVRTEFI